MRRALTYSFIILLILVSVINIPLKNVSAQSNYRRIITTDTPFFSDANGTDLLFYLPYTYYVKVLEQDNGNYTHVEYCGNEGTPALDGYVPTSMLFEDNLSVQNPYPSVSVVTINTTVLYTSSKLDQTEQYLFKDRQLTYYGTNLASDNTVLFFVGYNGKLGYVKETDVYPFTLQNHPNELTFIPTTPTPESPSTPQTPALNNANGDFFSLRVIIIACLLLAGIIALFVAVSKRPKKSTTVTYYDENDFE